MQENTQSDSFETISNRFLDLKLVCSEKIRSIVSISVSDSFSSRRTDYQECRKKTKSDHFEAISNRFLVLKLVYSEKIRLIASISVSDSFSSRGTDHQKWRRKLSRSTLKAFPIDFSTQISFIMRQPGQSHQFQFRTIFHQEEPVTKNAGEH